MSLEPAVEGILSEVITSFMNEGRMFTAFEVSLAAKERGVEERHRNMRERVHELIHEIGGPGGAYSRTLMDVGAPEQAWVYHPMTANPYLYEPLLRHDQPKRTRTDPVPRAPRNPLAIRRGVANPYAIPDGAFGTDQRGRLTVPVSMLVQMGVGPGQRVDVTCDAGNEQLLLHKSAVGTTTDNPDTTYTAERDGNVRITQRTLERAGLDGVQTYRIEGNGTVVSVKRFQG